YGTVAVVYFPYDLFAFPVDRKVILVKGGEVLLLLKNFQHLFRKIGSTSAAVLPIVSKRDTHTLFFAPVKDEIPFLIRICNEIIQCNNRFHSEFVCILHVLFKV